MKTFIELFNFGTVGLRATILFQKGYWSVMSALIR